MFTKYPEHIKQLVAFFKKFSGVGGKSAERMAFELLHWPEKNLEELAEVIAKTKERLSYCKECGALMEQQCLYCTRKEEMLCIVLSIRDVFLIEETRQFAGLYHVLGRYLYPFEEKNFSGSTIAKIQKRIEARKLQEVILALDATVEGDATALFLKKELAPLSVKISRLAYGLPMGSSFDFIDGGTLTRAFAGRLMY